MGYNKVIKYLQLVEIGNKILDCGPKLEGMEPKNSPSMLVSPRRCSLIGGI